MKSLKEQTLGNRVTINFSESNTAAIFEAGGHQRHELGEGFLWSMPNSGWPMGMRCGHC